MHVLKKIPHRHYVFSITKILRRYFLYDRKLLADLSRCAWESLKVFIQDAAPENDPIPAAVIAMQTFGDFLGYNPHTHILVTTCLSAYTAQAGRLPHPSRMTSRRSPPMTITFMGILNTHGTITSKHNAS
jgi:hypothetical protein